jgi:general secretion pathway protein D
MAEVNPFTTVQRQEVGTILKITPQVNEGGALVQLKINIESSALSARTGDANSAITNKRTIDTNVLIEDGGIVVLGGLIQDGDTRGEAARALPGQDPGHRRVVQDPQSQARKAHLMVFIRPKILRDGLAAAIETDAKYNYMRQEQLARRSAEIRGAAADPFTAVARAATGAATDAAQPAPQGRPVRTARRKAARRPEKPNP